MLTKMLRLEYHAAKEGINGKRMYRNNGENIVADLCDAVPGQALPVAIPNEPLTDDLEKLLKETEATFSETLLKLIDKTGKKDSEIYKKANVDRKLFSKIFIICLP